MLFQEHKFIAKRELDSYLVNLIIVHLIINQSSSDGVHKVTGRGGGPGS